MLSELSYIYEEKIPQQPLTSLIGLDIVEINLLAELGNQAKNLAPALGKALTARIQEFASWSAGYSLGNTEMQLYLQDWFLQIFQCREENYIPFDEYFLRIPLNLVITGIDIILTYGLEVTQSGLNPERATRAFHKALAVKITSEQLQSQMQDTQHFTEMILLD